MKRGYSMHWIREAAGWGLVLFSLYLIHKGLEFAMDMASPRIVEAAIVSFAGLGVLRAGVLLIRVATAARVCRLDSD